MATTTPRLTKAERRAAEREQAIQLQAEAAAKELRTKRILWSIIGVSVAALFGLGFWLFSHGGNSAADEAVSFDPVPVSQVANIPAHTNPDGGIVISQGLEATNTLNPALPTLAVYLDYMCPACNAFENMNFEDLKQLAESGTANVVMHPVAILDRLSLGTAFSTRAAAAAAWVADHSPASFLRFHELMFERQPGENTGGLTNAQIADIAREAGAPEDVAEGIADGTAANTFGQWATSVTHEAGGNEALRNPQSGGFGTPTVTINDQVWTGNWMVPGTLHEAVTTANAS